jgi:DNA-binding transcriptional MerR regulator
MEKYRAIPKGYMTVGELAKKMNTTVRTLQYYDREGLLKPSAESEGRRRLYTHRDIIRLHQIQSFKYLGFSLDDIKYRLSSLDTPEEVADALTDQANAVREKIASLTEILDALETLKAETLQMKSVDLERYADIVVLLQQKNEYYWVAKHFDTQTWDYIRNRYDRESGEAFFANFKRLCLEASECQKAGVPPESERGLVFAGEWWAMVMEFAGGDLNMLPNLVKFYESRHSDDNDFNKMLNETGDFIARSLDAYFMNPENREKIADLEGVLP